MNEKELKQEIEKLEHTLTYNFSLAELNKNLYEYAKARGDEPDKAKYFKAAIDCYNQAGAGGKSADAALAKANLCKDRFNELQNTNPNAKETQDCLEKAKEGYLVFLNLTTKGKTAIQYEDTDPNKILQVRADLETLKAFKVVVTPVAPQVVIPVTPQDDAEKELEKKANAGDVKARLQLGDIYKKRFQDAKAQNHPDINKYFDLARSWYERAGSTGFSTKDALDGLFNTASLFEERFNDLKIIAPKQAEGCRQDAIAFYQQFLQENRTSSELSEQVRNAEKSLKTLQNVGKGEVLSTTSTTTTTATAAKPLPPLFTKSATTTATTTSTPVTPTSPVTSATSTASATGFQPVIKKIKEPMKQPVEPVKKEKESAKTPWSKATPHKGGKKAKIGLKRTPTIATSTAKQPSSTATSSVTSTAAAKPLLKPLFTRSTTTTATTPTTTTTQQPPTPVTPTSTTTATNTGTITSTAVKQPVVPVMLTPAAPVSPPPQPLAKPSQEQVKAVREEIFRIGNADGLLNTLLGMNKIKVEVSESGEIAFTREMPQLYSFTKEQQYYAAHQTTLETPEEGKKRTNDSINKFVKLINETYPNTAEAKNGWQGDPDYHTYVYKCIISPENVLKISQALEQQKLQAGGAPTPTPNQ